MFKLLKKDISLSVFNSELMVCLKKKMIFAIQITDDEDILKDKKRY